MDHELLMFSLNDSHNKKDAFSKLDDFLKKIEDINPKYIYFGAQESTHGGGFITKFNDELLSDGSYINITDGIFEIKAGNSNTRLGHNCNVASALYIRSDLIINNIKINKENISSIARLHSLMHLTINKGAIKISFNTGKLKFVIVNTHLYFKAEDVEQSYKTRADELTSLLEHLLPYYNEGCFVIIHGDLNFRLDPRDNQHSMLINKDKIEEHTRKILIDYSRYSLLESVVAKNLFSSMKSKLNFLNNENLVETDPKKDGKKVVQKYKKVLLKYDQLYRYFSDRVSTQNNGFSNSFNKNIPNEERLKLSFYKKMLNNMLNSPFFITCKYNTINNNKVNSKKPDEYNITSYDTVIKKKKFLRPSSITSRLPSACDRFLFAYSGSVETNVDIGKIDNVMTTTDHSGLLAVVYILDHETTRETLTQNNYVPL